MVIVAGACGDGMGPSGETGGDSGSAASTTEAEGTGSGSTGAVEPTTGEAASSGETSAGEPTTGEAASSGGPGTEDPCADFCAAAVACAPELDVPSCIDAFCYEEEDPTAACLEATDARHVCFANLDCDDMLAWIEGDDPGPCAGAVAEEVEQCTGEKACDYSAEGAIDGTFCTIDFECLLEPPQSMQCDTETCTCVEDGRTGGTCESAEICASWTDLDSIQMLVDKAATCCGFGPAT